GEPGAGRPDSDEETGLGERRVGSRPSRASALHIKNSKTEDCGNLGAPPKPPSTASKDCLRRSTAASSAASSNGSSTGLSSAPPERRSRSCSPLALISSPRSPHASPTASNTCLNEGIPGRSWGGK